MATGTPRGRDLDGREQHRDRGRRPHVLAPQPGGREAEVASRALGGALCVDTNATGRRWSATWPRRRPHRRRPRRRCGEPRPVDPAIEARPEWAGIEQAREPQPGEPRRDPRAGRASRTAAPDDPCDHVALAHLDERHRCLLVGRRPAGQRRQRALSRRRCPAPDRAARRGPRGGSSTDIAPASYAPRPPPPGSTAATVASRRSKAAVPGRCRHRPGRRR